MTAFAPPQFTQRAYMGLLKSSAYATPRILFVHEILSSITFDRYTGSAREESVKCVVSYVVARDVLPVSPGIDRKELDRKGWIHTFKHTRDRQ